MPSRYHPAVVVVAAAAGLTAYTITVGLALLLPLALVVWLNAVTTATLTAALAVGVFNGFTAIFAGVEVFHRYG